MYMMKITTCTYLYVTSSLYSSVQSRQMLKYIVLQVYHTGNMSLYQCFYGGFFLKNKYISIFCSRKMSYSMIYGFEPPINELGYRGSTDFCQQLNLKEKRIQIKFRYFFFLHNKCCELSWLKQVLVPWYESSQHWQCSPLLLSVQQSRTMTISLQ